MAATPTASSPPCTGSARSPSGSRLASGSAARPTARGNGCSARPTSLSGGGSRSSCRRVRPERADLAQPGGRFAQVGLRMHIHSTRKEEPDPAPPPDVRPAAPTVVPLEPDVYLVRLYVPGARRVELKGDVTDWEVVAMRRSDEDPDVWEATFRKPAGVYHVNIRVDGGEWVVPPGLLAVPDRFGGAVGVLDFPSTQEVNDAT